MARSGGHRTHGVSRLIVAGHSFAFTAPYGPYGGSTAGGPFPRDQSRFVELFADLEGISEARRFAAFTVPATAALDDTITAVPIPEDCIVEGVWYIPNGNVTGQATNTRQLVFTAGSLIFGQSTLASIQLDAGIDLDQWVPYTLISIPVAALSRHVAYYDAVAGAYTSISPNQPSVNPGGTTGFGVDVGQPNLFTFQSLAVGTGLADPGGTLVVRLGGRFRNMAVAASRLLDSGIYLGGWATAWSLRPPSQLPAAEVNVTSDAAGGATSIDCGFLARGVSAGQIIPFSNGVTATVTASAATAANAITVDALSGPVPAGTQGHATSAAGRYDGYAPLGLWLWCHGVNDASLATQDRTAWREAVRASIAASLCPYVAGGVQANIVHDAGDGAGAAWANSTQPNGGQWFRYDPLGLAVPDKVFTGAIGATPPTITIEISEAFTGGTVDLFFIAAQGAAMGAAGTIQVDGAEPPQGAVTVDTASIFNGGTNLVSLVGVTTTNGSPTVTGAGFNDVMLGCLITGPGIPPGTLIAGVATDGTSLTLRDFAGGAVNATASATVTLTARRFLLTVKRLTGLGAGPLTVTVTLTSIDADDASAFAWFAGYGIEASNPPPYVLWHNIARYPAADAGDLTNLADLNTDTLAVLAGTAAAHGTASTEPALPASVLHLDLDALLANDVANFSNDGIHPNTIGNEAMAALCHRATSVVRADSMAAR